MSMALCNLVMVRRAAASVAVLLAFASSVASAADATDAPIAILMDADTGNVLFERRADEPFAPGGMSKLMTLTLVFRELKAGRIDRNGYLPVSENAWRKGGPASKSPTMFLPLGGRVSIDELVRGTAIVSANDGAIALAEGISGSEDAFAKLMNDEARALGLQQSTFRNSTGIYDAQHQMSARDIVLLARHIVKEYPDYYAVFGQRDFTFNRVPLTNHNPLLQSHPGVDGIATGFVQGSGYGIAFSAMRNGRRLIGMVMGLKTREQRAREASRLLAYGFGDAESTASSPTPDNASRTQSENRLAPQFECRNYFPSAGVVLDVPCME
jgi:serine-type D-Ala-D-Ala carboxypeptidase (penicillin-binding protein 5/6)